MRCFNARCPGDRVRKPLRLRGALRDRAMTDLTFETALSARVDEMVDACTRCGKCVEVCPSVPPAGLADASPSEVIGGVLDILRTGQGPEISRRWASACMLHGDCIRAC